MKLKNYQEDALDNLAGFLDAIDDFGSLSKAYKKFFEQHDAEPDKPYQDTITGVPRVCLKVPTGGGKTLIAAASLKILCGRVKHNLNKVIVWLVPSETILTQTLNNLKNVNHAYRDRLNNDFYNCVNIYSKEDLLSGADFSPQSAENNLCVLILSYDSFSGSKRKDWLRSFKDNENLMKFEPYIKDDKLLNEAEEFSLIQVIRHYLPIIVVDESHHTSTPLRQDMLENFNPSFILELTATPRENANIIFAAPALALKNAGMVKLPVLVYNRHSRDDVIRSAVTFRNELEKIAQAEGIRPIVLFQAESKGKENRATFDKVKEDLIKLKIPSEEIAIKTAEINELKNIDLMSDNCKIKYIITINALKEGWDCPFAYILASLADKKSRIDVEQILGRILRRPFTKNFKNNLLNMCYVFTAVENENLRLMLQDIITGLNASGFSEQDYRALNDQFEIISDNAEQLNLNLPPEPEPEPVNISTNETHEPEQKRADAVQSNYISQVSTQLGINYDKKHEPEELTLNLFANVNNSNNKIYEFKMKTRFKDEAEKILLPQFFMKTPSFAEDSQLISRENLCGGFNLDAQEAQINFNILNYQVYRIDIEDGEDVPTYKKLSEFETQAFMQYFAKLDIKGKRDSCARAIYNKILENKKNIARKVIDDAAVLRYIKRITLSFDTDRVQDSMQNLNAYAKIIEDKIDKLLAVYAKKIFADKLDINQIMLKPSYKLPGFITPINNNKSIANSLYEAEEQLANNFETKLAESLASLDNIVWWHKNRIKNGFCLNAFINHYPDFIARTKNNITLLIETKGDHLDNTDSKLKSDLGEKWESMAGNNFKYFMVFDNNNNLDNTLNFQDFMNKVKYL